MAAAAHGRLAALQCHLRPRESIGAGSVIGRVGLARTAAASAEAGRDALFAAEPTEMPPGATVEVLSASGMGVRVRGIANASRLERRHARWLLSLLYTHKVLAVAGQGRRSPMEHAEYAAMFGRPESEVWYRGTGNSAAPERPPPPPPGERDFSDRRGMIPGFPEVLVITSLGPGSFKFAPELGPPYLVYDLEKSAAQARPNHEATMQWHTDNSYEENPASATTLFVNRSCAAGPTQLTDMCAAYRALPEATKRRIAGLVVPHYTGPGIVAPHMRKKYDDRWVEGVKGSSHDTANMTKGQVRASLHAG